MTIFLVLLICCFIQIWYLIEYRPFEEDKLNKLEIFNEITNLVLLYHMLMFTEWISDASSRYLVGWSFIACNAGNLLVHFSLLLKDTYGQMKLWCMKKCCKKKFEELEEVSEKKVSLSVIEEVSWDDVSFESNFTDNQKKLYSEKMPNTREGKKPKWKDEDLGNFEEGFKLENIGWVDLGHRFIRRFDPKKIRNMESFKSLSLALDGQLTARNSDMADTGMDFAGHNKNIQLTPISSMKERNIIHEDSEMKDRTRGTTKYISSMGSLQKEFTGGTMPSGGFASGALGSGGLISGALASGDEGALDSGRSDVNQLDTRRNLKDL